MQIRFTHIVSPMSILGKTLSNEEFIIKIVICILRGWQPKFTMICESKNLETVDIDTLFGKLQEYEMKLKIIVDDVKDNMKKRKSIALKVANIEDMESEDEDLQSEIDKFVKLMFQKLKEFLRHEKTKLKTP